MTLAGWAPALLDARPRPTGPWEPAWSIHPSVVAGTLLLGALVVWGVRAAPRPPGATYGATRRASLAGALAVLVAALNGPIHDLSDYYLFSVHMAQHLLLTLVFPPLLLFATPGWLLAPLFRPAPVRAAARLLGHPLVAAGTFNACLAAWHIVQWYDLMMRDHDVHIVTHVLFMVTATQLWWPVMHRVPGLPRLTPGLGMLYVFLAGVPMQALAAIITFAGTPLYSWYVAAPRTWGLSPLDDQKLGGLLMWVPGNLWLFGAIAILFWQFVREQEGAGGR